MWSITGAEYGGIPAHDAHVCVVAKLLAQSSANMKTVLESHDVSWQKKTALVLISARLVSPNLEESVCQCRGS